VAGRWSLAAGLFAEQPSADERSRARAEVLLERHGVVTRAAALGDGVPGGFAGVYRPLADLETLGRCRRGYFLAGLGGAQFALPGAVERLREEREPGQEPEALVLGAADPAQPYGAALPWPRRPVGGRSPARAFGAQLVLLDGRASLYLERGGRSLLALREPEAEWLAAAIGALADWIRAEPGRRAQVERLDGEPVFGSPAEALLLEAGFRQSLRGLELRS